MGRDFKKLGEKEKEKGGEGRTKEEGEEKGGGRERQRRERVQAGKPEVKKIQEDRYREILIR